MEEEYLHKEITDRIICGYYNVYNSLGPGWREKPYERAMMVEMRHLGLTARAQVPVPIYYRGELLCEDKIDVIVEDKVILEVKACESLCKEHEAQLLSYLKATKIEVGLLIKFGPKPEIRRRVMTNDRKHHLF